jgi:hypothetical protein
MRKGYFIGSVQYAASRAFIPVIEEVAAWKASNGVFYAQLHTLVVVESEGSWIYPFGKKVSLEELLDQIPNLSITMRMAQLALEERLSSDVIRAEGLR